MLRIVSALVVVCLVGFAWGADPARPDVKDYPEVWKGKNGVTVEVDDLNGFERKSAAVFIKIKNGGKEPIDIPGQLDDYAHLEGKGDPKSPLTKLTLADDWGDTIRCAGRGQYGEKDNKKPATLKPGEEVMLTLTFPRPPVSTRYFLTVPGDLIGVPGEAKVSFPVKKFHAMFPDK